MSLADEFDAITSGGPPRKQRPPISTTQQADATRAPSGLTQQLAADVKRKTSVLAEDARGLRGTTDDPHSVFTLNDDIARANDARKTAFWGRTPAGAPTTLQDLERDQNVEDVGSSLDAAHAHLIEAIKADAARRNK